MSQLVCLSLIPFTEGSWVQSPVGSHACGFSPWMGCVPEENEQCFSHISVSVSHSLSLKSINIQFLKCGYNNTDKDYYVNTRWKVRTETQRSGVREVLETESSLPRMLSTLTFHSRKSGNIPGLAQVTPLFITKCFITKSKACYSII